MNTALFILTLVLLIVLLVRTLYQRHIEDVDAESAIPETVIKVECPRSTPWFADVPLVETQPTDRYQYTIVLESTADCPPVHKLYPLFSNAKKDFEGQPVEFRDSVVERCPGKSYPRLLKIRRNGDVLEYEGYPDYAAIADWIRNEALLV